jgi:hypothetical protein
MDRERIAGALGAAIAALVFVFAVAQSLKQDTAKQVLKVEIPKVEMPRAPIVRGPVVRDITP